MKTAYLDYNIIASMVGNPPQPDALDEVQAALRLQPQVKFVLSAWTAYELAQSQDAAHVRQCADFIEKMQPSWVSDARHIIEREISGFLERNWAMSGAGAHLAVPALNSTLDRMWSTYGLHVAGKASFTDMVAQFRSDPKNLQTIQWAAAGTRQAIATLRGDRARRVSLKDRIEREYLAERIGCAITDPRVDFLMGNRKRLYRECQTLAIEDVLTELRANDQFSLKLSHAADLQHGMAALGYCDHFVTRDGQLRNHAASVVNQLHLACRVHGRIADIVPP